MYKFPFPLEVGKTDDGTPVFGYRTDGIFRHNGFYDYDADDPNIGLSTLNDGYYLDNLNSALHRATSAAFAGVREVVSRFTGESCSGFAEENKHEAQLAEGVANYFAGELAYQETHGARQMSELTTRYNAVLALSLDQCAKLLPAGVTELGATELKILLAHDQERICSRLPEFGAAIRKLGWGEKFYDQLAQDGTLPHFYVLLKEVQKTYLDH